MKTRLTELLGIETPIICGGMMRVGTAELAAAASNAGALGVKAERIINERFGCMVGAS